MASSALRSAGFAFGFGGGVNAGCAGLASLAAKAGVVLEDAGDATGGRDGGGVAGDAVGEGAGALAGAGVDAGADA
jgi:hypothetical protein